jgi:hypothetical protein
MRKGKNSKSSKLKKIGIIAKRASQDFQRRKWFVKQSYGSKDIHSQSFGQPSPVNRDESTSVLLTSTSVRMMSASVQGTWHNQESDTCHDDVNMMMWQHQRLPRVTHFWHFQVDMWTNEKVPHVKSVQPRGRTYRTWK